MQKHFAAISLVILAMIIFSAGCTVLNKPPEPTPVPTPEPTPVPTTVVTTAKPVATPTPSINPEPTDALPEMWPLSVSVEKAGTYSMTIMTTFDGGKGASAVLRLTSTVTRPDGTVTTKSIERPKRGDIIEIEGTRGPDRLQVFATMNSGETFKVIDQQVPYKTRG